MRSMWSANLVPSGNGKEMVVEELLDNSRISPSINTQVVHSVLRILQPWLVPPTVTPFHAAAADEDEGTTASWGCSGGPPSTNDNGACCRIICCWLFW